MNRTKRIATNVLLGCLIIALMFLHIKYLMWDRQCFAVGGEWFVYSIAIVAYVWRLFGNDN